MKVLDLGGAGTVPATITGNKNFTGNVIIGGTLDVTGVATFTTTVTGSGNIMAGAAFALGFTGRSQFKSSADGLITAYFADGSTLSRFAIGAGSAAATLGLSIGGFGGMWSKSGSVIHSVGAIDVGGFGYDNGNDFGLRVRSNGGIGFSSTTDPGAGTDTNFFRVSAGIAGVCGPSPGSHVTLAGFQPAQSANGATLQMLSASESLTLSTSGTTTDTSANLLPAGAIIHTVVARITTTITTATSWQLGDPTTAGRFTAANATMTANTTDIGTVHRTTGVASATTGMIQTAAAKVRVTTVGTPGAGVIRITVFYTLLTPPTS